MTIVEKIDQVVLINKSVSNFSKSFELLKKELLKLRDKLSNISLLVNARGEQGH